MSPFTAVGLACRLVWGNLGQVFFCTLYISVFYFFCHLVIFILRSWLILGGLSYGPWVTWAIINPLMSLSDSILFKHIVGLRSARGAGAAVLV